MSSVLASTLEVGSPSEERMGLTVEVTWDFSLHKCKKRVCTLGI